MAQNELLPMPVALPLALATADTGDVLHGLWGGDGNAALEAAWLLTDDDVTADDTDYAQIVLAVGATTLATMKTQATAGAGVTGDITAGAAVAFEISGAMGALLESGESVTVTVTKPGNGVALTGRVVLGFRRVL